MKVVSLQHTRYQAVLPPQASGIGYSLHLRHLAAASHQLGVMGKQKKFQMEGVQSSLKRVLVVVDTQLVILLYKEHPSLFHHCLVAVAASFEHGPYVVAASAIAVVSFFSDIQ